MPNFTGAGFQARDLGLLSYAQAWTIQQERMAARKAGRAGDTLLLVEHPHVITLGRSARREHLLEVPPGVEVHQTNRGGDVTYHGPGQLVGYPIFDLAGLRRAGGASGKDVAWYVRSLEEALIGALAGFGIRAGRLPGLTGVWVEGLKIAALGVHLSRWVTCHGFALNVNTDLRYFACIIPCGIRDHGVVSMARWLGREVDMNEVKRAVVDSFQKTFYETPCLAASSTSSFTTG